jgi:hypothetical protein
VHGGEQFPRWFDSLRTKLYREVRPLLAGQPSTNMPPLAGFRIAAERFDHKMNFEDNRIGSNAESNFDAQGVKPPQSDISALNQEKPVRIALSKSGCPGRR